MPAIGTTIRALLISLGGLVAATAWADDSTSRWTFGTQLGQVRSSGNESAPSSSELSTMSYDASAMWGDKHRLGWRVFTGWRFTDYLAVHVGYTDLGKVRAPLIDPAPGQFAEPERVMTQKIRGMDAGLQLKIPLSDRFAAELRGGKYFWKSQTRVPAQWGDVAEFTRRGSDNFYGAGIEVGVMDDLRGTLGWTRYEVAGEPVHLWTVGVLYGFGFF